MMMADKKLQKKKAREKAVKKKVLDRRLQIRSEAREKAKWELEEKAAEPKKKPLCTAESRKEQAARDDEIRKQLRHNIELLKAIEEEYLKESGAEPNTITICQTPEAAE